MIKGLGKKKKTSSGISTYFSLMDSQDNASWETLQPWAPPHTHLQSPGFLSTSTLRWLSHVVTTDVCVTQATGHYLDLGLPYPSSPVHFLLKTCFSLIFNTCFLSFSSHFRMCSLGISCSLCHPLNVNFFHGFFRIPLWFSVKFHFAISSIPRAVIDYYAAMALNSITLAQISCLNSSYLEAISSLGRLEVTFISTH